MITEDLNKSIAELEAKSSALHKDIYNLEKQDNKIGSDIIALKQAKLRPLVGLCCKSSDNQNFWKIVDVPQLEYETFVSSIPSHINLYQLPVLCISDSLHIGDKGILFDTLYSKAVDAEDSLEYFKSERNIISLDEFNAELDKMMIFYKSLGVDYE
jgi:hypothetical protein